MPFVKKYKSRKPRARKARKTRVPRSLGMRTRDIASCSDTLALISVMPNMPYALVNIALTNSIRAKTIAQGYQFYRISRVDVQWKPQFDTFTAGGTSSAPNLYYMIDKANTFPSNATVDTLKQAGAKAVRLDESVIRRSFKPAVHIVSDDNNGGAAPVVETAGLTRVSPWITTNANAGQGTTFWAPNSVDHRGIIFVVEQQATAPAATVCTVELTVHYEFKKPLWTGSGQEPTVQYVDLDLLTEPSPSSAKLPVAE